MIRAGILAVVAAWVSCVGVQAGAAGLPKPTLDVTFDRPQTIKAWLLARAEPARAGRAEWASGISSA